MPIIRKIVEIGNSKAIFLPKTWLQYYESQIGQEIRFVAVEVDKKLEIEPYIPKNISLLTRAARNGRAR